MLSVTGARHSYPGTTVLNGVSLRLDEGRIGCLIGNSGCGKTTLLRCIAGFETLSDGRIEIDAELHSGSGVHRAPQHRPVGMVFQDFALLPHLSVADNIAFALHDRPPRKRQATISEMLALVGLSALATRMPHELSGGQQQRVALARSLARKPKLLLLDEPFSNLDASLREQLGGEVRALLKQLKMTALFVTHDQREAFSLSDDIGIMRDGQLLQWDSAYDVYHRPVSRAVADFIGGGGWLPGVCHDDHAVDTSLGRLCGRLPDHIRPGAPVQVLLRPDDVVHDDAAPLKARIASKQFRGATFLYELRTDDGTMLQSVVPSHHNHAVGELIGIRLDTEHMVVFSAD